MEASISLLFIAPIAAMALISATKKGAQFINLAAAVVCSLASVIVMLTGSTESHTILSDYILVSPLGNWVTLCVAIVYLGASAYSIGYMKFLGLDQKRISRYYSLMAAFALTMFIAPLMNNPGLFWIAIDLTTIVSAFLVGFEKEARSIEAAWKYLIIVSAGLSLALIGTVLFYWGGTLHAGNVYALTWERLHSVAPEVPSRLLLLSFLLVLVGFGTKAGLVPMHTWLPDAHSEGPVPVSAMLSGALLNTAMLGIVRFLAILDGTGVSSAAHGTMVVLGILSLMISALFIIGQKDIKRLMAYSSIEHIGIITLGFGFGGILGVAGSMYQMLNHSLSKSLMFFGSGTVMRGYGSKSIPRISRILKYFPAAGIAWLLGALAITGAPPFALFQSELAIVRSGLSSPEKWAVWIMAIFLVVIFAGFMNHFRNMYFTTRGPSPINMSASGPWTVIPMWIALIAVLVLGIWWPPYLYHFFIAAGRSL